MRQRSVLVLVLVMLACTSTPPARRAVSTPAGDVVVPVVLHQVEPDYPADLRRAGIGGVVIVSATITKDGKVADTVVMKSPNPVLDQLAVAAVRKWQFKPATINGEPVEVKYMATVTFHARR
jgi:protein TonB